LNREVQMIVKPPRQDASTRPLFGKFAVELVALTLFMSPLNGARLDGQETTAPLTQEERQQRLEVARQLLSEGRALVRANNLPDAHLKFVESLRRLRECLSPTDREFAGLYLALADVAQKQGKAEQAERHFEDALVIQERHVPESLETARTLNFLGLLHAARGDDQRSRERLERALRIREGIQGPGAPSLATLLSNLGSMLQRLGEYSQSEEMLQRSLRLSESQAGVDAAQSVAALNNLVVTYMWWGRYADAKRLNERSLRILSASSAKGDAVKLGKCLFNQGLIATMTGDFASAETSYGKALAVFEQTLGAQDLLAAATRAELGLLHHTLGDFDRARQELRQSLAITEAARGSGSRDAVRIRGNLGLAEQRLGNEAEALRLLTDCLERRIQDRGPQHAETAASHVNLGQLYQDQGLFDQAAKQFETALGIQRAVLGNRHGETAVTLNSLGRLHLLRGQADHARTALDESLAIRRELLDVTAHVQTERQQLLLNRLVRGTLNDRLSVIDSSPVEAYAHVLRWKGAVFVRQSLVRGSSQASQQPSHPEHDRVVRELRETSNRLASLALSVSGELPAGAREKQLLALAAERDGLESELAALSPAHQQATRMSRLSPQALRDLLPTGATLIDFLEYDRLIPTGEDSGRVKGRRERHFVAFVVRSGQAEIVRVELGPAAPIDVWVERWLRESRLTADSPVTEPALALRRLVWLPLEPFLDKTPTILISADGSLGKLPFVALPGRKPDSYLLEEDFSLAMLPLPQFLLNVLSPDPRRPAERDLLVVGGVDYDRETAVDMPRVAAPSSPDSANREALLQWDKLPGTEAEADSIRELFQRHHPSRSMTWLRGREATEEQVKSLAPSYRYLHFATHGFFAPPELLSSLNAGQGAARVGQSEATDRGQFLGVPPGLLTGIVLAGANQPGPGEDGTLTAIEVDALDLSQVDLIVLSACETGLGHVASGEGLLGLQRSFHLAGARSVIGTLWKVDDVKSRQLMESFYQQRWGQTRPTLQALRAAQLTLLQDAKGQHSAGESADRSVRVPRSKSSVKIPRTAPHYWAGFVLSGDWR
jgi:CHAT domain-containing protein/tetratricopeptide (TPR) repeat protein